MAHDLTGQMRVQRLAPTLLAAMAGHFDRSWFHFLGHRRTGRRQGFGFVEEEITSSRRARLRLGREEPAQIGIRALFQPIVLNRHSAELVGQPLALSQQGLVVFSGERDHRGHQFIVPMSALRSYPILA
jgi:hypothetical protein